MNNIPSNDLLRTVQEYFDTVTPEQFKEDLDKSNFDFYNKIGASLLDSESINSNSCSEEESFMNFWGFGPKIALENSCGIPQFLSLHFIETVYCF